MIFTQLPALSLWASYKKDRIKIEGFLGIISDRCPSAGVSVGQQGSAGMGCGSAGVSGAKRGSAGLSGAQRGSAGVRGYFRYTQI